MLACGSYIFNPSPPPEAVVDKSSFNELPIEERLDITQRNFQHLKEALRLKESDHQDLEHELKFHAIKNEELMDVINAFRSTSSDRSHEIMRAKAEQNSELTLQVHALRDLLTKSGEEVAALQTQLKEKTLVGKSLSSNKLSHQRLQVQLSGLVKTLNNVEVSSVDIPSEWINAQWMTGGGAKNTANGNNKTDGEQHTNTVQIITRKIIAMEADRQRLLKESRLYNQSDGQKEARIVALERQVRQMQHEQDELQETNSALRRQICVREGKIGALEELFQNINANRTIEAVKPKKTSQKGNTATTTTSFPRGDSRYPGIERSVSLMNDDDDDEEEEMMEDVDIDSLTGGKDCASNSVSQSFEEIFTNIWTNFTGGTIAPTITTEENYDIDDDDASNASKSFNANDDDQDVSSCFSDSYHTKQVEEELQAAARREFEELQESHHSLREDYESAQFKISDLTARLEESIIKANSFEKKAELREGLLKDVIQQYKELQLEHSASTDRLGQLKLKVTILLQLEKERAQERAQERPSTAANGEKIVGKGNSKDSHGSAARFLQEESLTFDMSEGTGSSSDEDDDNDDMINGLDKNFVMEDYKRLESECDRLQHEFDTAIANITALEEKLDETKHQAHESQVVHADQARTIALLEGEKLALQERVIEVTAKIVDTRSTHTQRTVEVEDELRSAELREQQAKEKQMEREQDLWDVIEQYKDLADQNESTKEEKAEVEHELFLTQKVKIQRRDLVYEYRKLEKAMEEAVETGEQLAKDLQMAKNDAARNKEETKGIRKRLAGCHFHYKQLQQQYDEVLKQNGEFDRRLSKAQKYEALHNTQAESWTAMMENVRDKRRAAEEKVDSLSKENDELHLYCNELMETAAAKLQNEEKQQQPPREIAADPIFMSR